MHEPKRILFICGASYVSGLEVVTLVLMKGLKARGHFIHCVVSGWNDGDFIGRLREEDIPYTVTKLGFFYFSKPRWTLDALVHLPQGLATFVGVKKRFRPDWVYHTSYRTVLTLYPFLREEENIFSLHEAHLPSLKNRLIYLLIEQKLARFTAVSEFIKTKLLDLGISEKKIAVVLNGVEIKNQNPLVSRPSSPWITRIGIVGQIGSWKGHEDLIDALRILAGRQTAFVCKIFGKGEDQYVQFIRSKVREYGLENYVEWKGFVKDQDEVYRDLDIVVVPSRSEEPCSLTIIESLTRGKPVIVTRRGGSPELVKDGVTGYIVAMKDAASIALRLEELIKDPFLAQSMALNAASDAQYRLSDQRMISAFENLLTRYETNP
ncbi:MAG: glycosyltransferase family 4 protein [Ferruginibacter sp.]|nr:glycosyltransferase family 4 protein [Cytophagales bacterium]